MGVLHVLLNILLISVFSTFPEMFYPAVLQKCNCETFDPRHVISNDVAFDKYRLSGACVASF